MVERFSVKEGTEIVLGRTDLRTSDSSHFDLTRYGGQDKGVSRNHALLRFSGEAITVTDLSSANGTFINTTRLEPNKPHALHTEDKLMLGSLSMVVRFE
jgi:pSer/pThr/pTyr-binding forkhead associated (FHA) protein